MHTAGFGGNLNAYELMKAMIEAGAAAVHFEDQLASAKKCGHMGGKVSWCGSSKEIIVNFHHSNLQFTPTTDSYRAHILPARQSGVLAWAVQH